MALPTAIEAVEFRRHQYGLTQSQWAYVLRWSPSRYSEFVNGKRSMNKRAMRWAFAHGVPAESLLQALPCLGSSDIDRRLASLRKQAKKDSTQHQEPNQ